MTARIPAFGDIGKTGKELLEGGKEGKFQFGRVLQVSSKTADGVDVAVNFCHTEGDEIASLVKVSKTLKNYGVTTSITSTGKVLGSFSINKPLPGLDVTVSGAVADPSSGKVTVDYTIPYVTLKGIVGLTPEPKVELAATTGYEGFVAGVDSVYDTEKKAVTKWTLAAGYQAADYQLGAFLTDFGDTGKLLWAHNVDKTTTVGVEVQKSFKKEGTLFTAGLAKRIAENNALLKFRVNNVGIASVLYEVEPAGQPGMRLAITGEADLLRTRSGPKYGFAVDYKL